MPSGRNSESFLGTKTLRRGKGSKEPFFKSRIRARRFSARLASNILMLTLSMPAAPRLRLTALKESRSNLGVILPVKEWTFCFLLLLIPIKIDQPRGDKRRAIGECYLAKSALTGKEHGRANGGLRLAC